MHGQTFKSLTRKTSFEEFDKHISPQLDLIKDTFSLYLKYKVTNLAKKASHITFSAGSFKDVTDKTYSGLISKNFYDNRIIGKSTTRLEEHSNQRSAIGKLIKPDMTDDDIKNMIFKYGFISIIDNKEGHDKSINNLISNWMKANPDNDFIDCYQHFGIQLGFVSGDRENPVFNLLETKEDVLDYLHSNGFDVL